MKRPDDVQPGEWGAGIIFYAPIKRTKEDPRTGEEVEVDFPMMKQYCVFNAEQVELPDNLRHLADIEPKSKNDEFIDFAPAEFATRADRSVFSWRRNSVRKVSERCQKLKTIDPKTVRNYAW